MPADVPIPTVTLIEGFYCWPWRMYVIDVDALGHEPAATDDPGDIRKALRQFDVDGRAAVGRGVGPETRQHTGLFGCERRPGGWSGNHLNQAEFLDIGFWEREDELFRLEVLKEDLEHLNAEEDPGIDCRRFRKVFVPLEQCSFQDEIRGFVTPARYIGTDIVEADLRRWSDCLYLQRIRSLWGSLQQLVTEDNPVSRLILAPSIPLKTKSELFVARLIGERTPATIGPEAKDEEDVTSDSPLTFFNEYRTARWGGKHFDFTVKQAEVVRRLHESYKAGVPHVLDADLLEAAESKSNRLSDLFKARGQMHAAWGKMIVRGSRTGTRRLAPPPCE